MFERDLLAFIYINKTCEFRPYIQFALYWNQVKLRPKNLQIKKKPQMITWDLRFWVVFQKNIIQTEWAFSIFHDTTAKCCMVGLMRSVYNSTWHLRQRLSVKNYSSEIEWKQNFFFRVALQKNLKSTGLLSDGQVRCHFWLNK